MAIPARAHPVFFEELSPDVSEVFSKTLKEERRRFGSNQSRIPRLQFSIWPVVGVTVSIAFGAAVLWGLFPKKKNL